MINVAVVGLGYWGPNLLRNLSLLKGVGIVALCDADIQRADVSRERFCPGARVLSDPREVARSNDVDAAVIATPIRTHYEIAASLIESGKHVFVEKPLASTTSECQALIDLANRHNRVLMVGHVFEYNSAVQRIKKYLDEEELGKIFYVYSQRVNLGRIQHDVNALWSFAPHDISIMNYWFGQAPVRVSARGFCYLNSGIEDVVFVTFEYANGVGAHLHLGWLDPRKVRLMTIVGSKKMLVYDDVSIDEKIRIYDKGVSRLHDFLQAPETFAEFQFKLRVGELTVPSIEFGEPLNAECQHFIDCVRHGRRPLSDGESGLRVVKVLEAVDCSLKQQGKVVEITAA